MSRLPTSSLRVLRPASAGNAVRCLLLLLLAILCWHVADGVKPWETHWAERVAEGKAPGLLDYVRAGTWVAALGNALVVAVLLATSHWWLRTTDPPPDPPPSARPLDGVPNAMDRRLYWLILAGILALSLLPRLPRMNHSLWGDEEWALRKHVHGRFVPADPMNPMGPLVFDSADWWHSLFYNRDGNNHHLFSIVQRLGIAAWKSATNAPEDAFSEPVSRFPSLAAGVASIAATALLLRRFGAPRAGLAAAALLAVHPMHVRYSTEARGYAIVILLLLVVLLLAEAARTRGRWRDWAALALVEFLAIYCWTAAVYPIAIVNLLLLAAILGRRRSEPLRRPILAPDSATGAPLWRWFVASSVAGAAFLQLYAPSAPQVKRAIETSSVMKGQPMDLHWLRDSAARLLSGTFFDSTAPESPVQLTLSELFSSRPVSHGLLIAAIAAFFLIGVIVAVRRSPWRSLLVAAPIAALALNYAHFAFGLHIEFRYWYQIYAYPSFLAFAAIGATEAGARLSTGTNRAGVAVRAAVPAAFVAAFAAATLPQNLLQIRHPLEDFRSAARLTRGRHGREFPDTSTKIITLAVWRSAPLYDPRIDTDVRTRAEIETAVATARANGWNLFYTVGNHPFVSAAMPELLETLEDPRLFRPLATLHSEDPMFSLHLYEMIPTTPAATGDIPVSSPASR